LGSHEWEFLSASQEDPAPWGSHLVLHKQTLLRRGVLCNGYTNSVFSSPHLPLFTSSQYATHCVRQTMPWLRWSVASLSQQSSRFDPKPVHMRFVVDRVALPQVFLPLLQFSPASVIPPMLHAHSPIYYWCCIMLHMDSIIIWTTPTPANDKNLTNVI
jgi:hypothetical protein